MDGRRGNGINKEIDFVGDQVVGSRVGLPPIDLDKENVFIDVTPGSTRTGQITVGNGSEDPVTVNVEFILPEHMLHVVNGSGIKGEDLGCVDWVTVQPPQFTMRCYGRRTLNLIVRMPPTATQYSNYYGTLRFHTTYRDGSPAGMRTGNARVPQERQSHRDECDQPDVDFFRAVDPGSLHGHVQFPQQRGDPRDAAMQGDSDARRGAGRQVPAVPDDQRSQPSDGIFALRDADVLRRAGCVQYAVGFLSTHGGLGVHRGNSSGQISPENQQNQMLIEIYEQDGQKAAKFAEWDKAPEGR